MANINTHIKDKNRTAYVKIAERCETLTVADSNGVGEILFIQTRQSDFALPQLQVYSDTAGAFTVEIQALANPKDISIATYNPPFENPPVLPADDASEKMARVVLFNGVDGVLNTIYREEFFNTKVKVLITNTGGADDRNFYCQWYIEAEPATIIKRKF